MVPLPSRAWPIPRRDPANWRQCPLSVPWRNCRACGVWWICCRPTRPCGSGWRPRPGSTSAAPRWMRSARPCSRPPSCSPAASARPPMWSARRCTPLPIGAIAAAPCGPRARPRWCAPPSSTACSARGRNGFGIAGRCSATSVPRPAASASSTRSGWNCSALPIPAVTWKRSRSPGTCWLV